MKLNLWNMLHNVDGYSWPVRLPLACTHVKLIVASVSMDRLLSCVTYVAWIQIPLNKSNAGSNWIIESSYFSKTESKNEKGLRALTQ